VCFVDWKQWLGLCRDQRKHDVVQHDHCGCATPRPVLHDHPGARHCRKPGEKEASSRVCWHIPGNRSTVCWFAGLHDFDRRRSHLFPGSESRANSRTSADERRKGFLRCPWTQSLKSEKNHSPTAPFFREQSSTLFANLTRARWSKTR